MSEESLLELKKEKLLKQLDEFSDQTTKTNNNKALDHGVEDLVGIKQLFTNFYYKIHPVLFCSGFVLIPIVKLFPFKCVLS